MIVLTIHNITCLQLNILNLNLRHTNFIFKERTNKTQTFRF